MIVELDPRDPRAVAEYERAFYGVFAPLTSNRLIRKLWLWDEEGGRLQTRVPYEAQTVYLERDAGGSVVRALAMATDLTDAQSEFYGFNVPKGPEVVEALTFFVVGRRGLAATIPFWNGVRQSLMARGYRTVVGTCSPSLLPLYRWVGGEVVDSREIEGELRYFFAIDLPTSGR